MVPHWYFSKEPSFFESVLNAGGDVLILNFANGAADLLENAAVV